MAADIRECQLGQHAVQVNVLAACTPATGWCTAHSALLRAMLVSCRLSASTWAPPTQQWLQWRVASPQSSQTQRVPAPHPLWWPSPTRGTGLLARYLPEAGHEVSHTALLAPTSHGAQARPCTVGASPASADGCCHHPVESPSSELWAGLSWATPQLACSSHTACKRSCCTDLVFGQL